jgi:hypothetical protein
MQTLVADFLVYMRGSSEDFDRYASVTSDSAWNWYNMQQYAKKVSANTRTVP